MLASRKPGIDVGWKIPIDEEYLVSGLPSNSVRKKVKPVTCAVA
jgi:hypothetical protein